MIDFKVVTLRHADLDTSDTVVVPESEEPVFRRPAKGIAIAKAKSLDRQYYLVGSIIGGKQDIAESI